MALRPTGGERPGGGRLVVGRKVYLETMGCQMNVLDSELVLGQLRAAGYERVDDSKAADVVLLNTCSVRDHAEQKVLARLGRLRKRKLARPQLIIGVLGCMAERDPDGLVARMPHVDVLCGPGELNKLPAMLAEVESTRRRAIALSQSMSRRNTPLQRAVEYDSVEALDLSRDPEPGPAVLQAYVRVQRGCDKFCTFCVVPFTRGPERSRPPGQIVDEARMLADRGAREITLLGQTVNSYAYPENDGPVRLAELLERVSAVEGVDRVRFVTNYPGDFTDDILYALRDLPKVCEYLHIPVQSGSDAVLKRMRRQYSVGQYLELIDRARDIVPGLAIASDFIVGFCGETPADHEASCRLLERCRFKNVFVFKYSPRPGTVADKREADDVPDEVKRQRNLELLKLQEQVALAANQRQIGSVVEVLVEGYSKAATKARETEHCRDLRDRRTTDPSPPWGRGQGEGENAETPSRGDAEPGSVPDADTAPDAEQSRGQEVSWCPTNQLVGRTRQDQIVVFAGPPSAIGRFADVRIVEATALTLHGQLLADAPR